MTIERIAICTTQVPFTYGGAEVLVEELNRQLLKRGFQSEIVAIPFQWYPKQELVNQALLWRLLDLKESNGKKIDRLICTKYPAYAIDHPQKVIWLFHQHRQIYDLLGTQYTYFNETMADFKCINQIKNIDHNTISEALKVFTISQNVSNRLHTYNGISSEVLYPPPKHEYTYHTREYGDYIFVAGRLDPLKRLDLVIKALAHTSAGLRLVIAGRGPQEAELKQLARDEGVAQRIDFRGFVDDKELLDLYARCFAVYFAPYDEDYGFITIEAFRSQKPVITTPDSGGVLEFVKNEISGFVVSMDPAHIAEKIQYLFDHKDQAAEMGKTGSQMIAGIHWDHTIRKLTAAY